MSIDTLRAFCLKTNWFVKSKHWLLALILWSIGPYLLTLRPPHRHRSSASPLLSWYQLLISSAIPPSLLPPRQHALVDKNHTIFSLHCQSALLLYKSSNEGSGDPFVSNQIAGSLNIFKARTREWCVSHYLAALHSRQPPRLFNLQIWEKVIDW